jgi:hypothetical protein
VRAIVQRNEKNVESLQALRSKRRKTDADEQRRNEEQQGTAPQLRESNSGGGVLEARRDVEDVDKPAARPQSSVAMEVDARSSLT